MFTALLGLTGVAAKVSAVILEMGGDYLLVSLAIAAIIPLVLGAPLPVAATYILSAALIAPALIRLKLDPAAVHMFLLYWATLASVTPPTCTACVVAANIAGGDWFKTSLVGMRLGHRGVHRAVLLRPQPGADLARRRVRRGAARHGRPRRRDPARRRLLRLRARAR